MDRTLPRALRPTPHRPRLPALLIGVLVLFITVPAPAPAQPTYETNVVPTGVPDGATGTNNITDAPVFYAPPGADDTLGTADDDYRPEKPAGSPLIDYADGAFITTTHALNGQTQTESAWDAGAFESHGEALPVELGSLTATLNGTDADAAVRLRWRTLNERQNSGFRVQRANGPEDESSSSVDWTTLGRVDGAGTTSERRTYRFTDDNLPFGAERLRYRLVQVDTDGSTETTDPVAVRRSAPDRVQLRAPTPNPARQQATLRFAVPEGHGEAVTLTIHDALGRTIRTIEPQSSGRRHRMQINVGAWPSGTYFIRLRAGPSVRTERLVVVK
ncbi:MAG: T9SS type A sorting domain-containing protein [Salinibacter sp.]